jgi:hypothetical protein
MSTTKKLSERKKLSVRVSGIEETYSTPPTKRASIPYTEKEIQARKVEAQSKMVRLAGGFPSRTASAYMSGDTLDGSGGNWYSPQLSTDFLEKPQNLRERRAWYRHFYNSSEIVGAAIDLHSTIPLSKLRLRKPKAANPHLAEYSYRFFSKMIDRLKLLQTLTEISHEYWMFGNVVPYVEDHNPYMDMAEDAKNSLKARGKAQSDLLLEKYKIRDTDPNYVGWRKITILPPDQVRIVRKPFSDNPIIEFLPDPETKAVLNRSFTLQSSAWDSSSDPFTQTRVPEAMLESLAEGGTILLQQNPSEGSFATHIARKKSQYETLGVSILERCVNTLLVKDKLRQAQTSIASRHMTPIRVVWGEKLNDMQLDDLRMQIDMSLMDPDYSIVANYEIHWDEQGSNQRLLDLTNEFERYDADLYAGLGVTKEMMTGEASYSGSKISLELLNIQYMLFREMLQEFVEKSLFEPVARRKGFVETDEYGNEVVIYPKISFTRMSIRDNDAVFEQVMQLYNKGSLPADDIYDILGLDGDAVASKLNNDLFTVKDASLNDLVRGAYQAAAQDLVQKTNLTQKAAEAMNLSINKESDTGDEGAAAGGMRFASVDPSLKKLFDKLASNPELVKRLVGELEGDTHA